ncbi:MAG: UDP-2,3-diacylglucosamine diphosphatase [Bacteroidales bacterium]|nr:UDP-2,3-diacylglucosamine diphosphatase [Bacteroidales bacterium]
MSRDLTYFVSDVHLGLDYKNPTRREERFVAFLRGIPADRTEALYMLGDIWDFWYEYEDVVPKGYLRVFSALLALMDAGVKVYFFEGNHDIWTYSYFESLGMVKLRQPHFTRIGGKRFCLGHGDGLGKGMHGYKFLKWVFHNRTLQRMFSALHPHWAFSLGNRWSRGSRLAKGETYRFMGEEEPLYQYLDSLKERADYYVFGHYHSHYEGNLPGGGRLMILRDWMDRSNWMVFDGTALTYVEPR